MAIFPGESGLVSFIGAKDDGSGGDNWSYKTCKTPVKCCHQQTNTQLFTWYNDMFNNSIKNKPAKSNIFETEQDKNLCDKPSNHPEITHKEQLLQKNQQKSCVFS